MPVPMIAPIPSIIRCPAPSTRFSSAAAKLLALNLLDALGREDGHAPQLAWDAPIGVLNLPSSAPKKSLRSS